MLESRAMPNCANCGAPLHAGEHGVLVCGHCGSLDEGVAAYAVDTLGASAVPCPQCGAMLDDARIEGLPVRHCPSCQGVLVEMKSFAALSDAVRARARTGAPLPRRQQPGDRVLTCPLCRQAMLGHLFGGPGNIVLDTCERCAVNWLDPGELRRIAQAP